MVGRRLREHGMYSRTVQIKLRYSDFTTLTRAHTLEQPTDIDIELIEHSRLLFRKNWNGTPVRLLGVQASSLDHAEGQLNLLEGEKTRRWRNALSAADKLRDRFGEKSISVASGLKGMYEERVHENPAGLREKDHRPRKISDRS
jgi:DNA polymerase-4